MINSSELAFLVIDSQIDYNMKLITMFLIFSFAVIGFWLGNRRELNSWADIIFVLMSKILFYPTILFTPLFILLLDREFTYITMWTWLMALYGVVFFIVFAFILVKGSEFIFRMVGLDISYSAWKDNKILKKESEDIRW